MIFLPLKPTRRQRGNDELWLAASELQYASTPPKRLPSAREVSSIAGNSTSASGRVVVFRSHRPVIWPVVTLALNGVPLVMLLAETLRRAGFVDVCADPLTFGIVYLYTARRQT